MRLLKLNSDGLAIEAQDLPADVVATTDLGALNENGRRLARLPDGSIGRVWDLRGFSCFGGSDGRTPTEVPDDVSMIGQSWSDLVAAGYLQAPKPMTPTEIDAKAKADADEAEAARQAQLAGLQISQYQLKAALLQKDLLTVAESWVSEQDAMTKLAWTTAAFSRGSRFVNNLFVGIDVDASAGDAIFEAAAQIMV